MRIKISTIDCIELRSLGVHMPPETLPLKILNLVGLETRGKPTLFKVSRLPRKSCFKGPCVGDIAPTEKPRLPPKNTVMLTVRIPTKTPRLLGCARGNESTVLELVLGGGQVTIE